MRVTILRKPGHCALKGGILLKVRGEVPIDRIRKRLRIAGGGIGLCLTFQAVRRMRLWLFRRFIIPFEARLAKSKVKEREKSI